MIYLFLELNLMGGVTGLLRGMLGVGAAGISPPEVPLPRDISVCP